MDGRASRTPTLGGDLPAEFVAAGAAIRAALVVAQRADEWSPGARAAAMAWVAKHKDVLGMVEGTVLTAERQAGTWALRGDRDLAGFLGRVSHAGRGAGLGAVGQAATLAAMPQVAEALVDGPVTSTHVAQITRATAASPTLAAELAVPERQEQVVELARRLDGADFGKALKRLSAELDPASRQRAHDEQHAARYLNISRTSGGTLVKAQLDDVAGYELGKAIAALDPRPALDDEHTGEQRRADALMTMVRRTLSDEGTTPGAVAPVQVIVTIAEETWTALRGARAVENGKPSKGSTADVGTTLRGVRPVVDERGQAWPASEVARALCDCTLTRAVVDASGQALDLGRDRRLFQRQHWVALLASGITTCVWPGCSMPLRNTELHHLTWWERDAGRTRLDNCGPYCRHHHDWIHNHDVRVTRLPDGGYEHRDRRGLLIGVGGAVGRALDEGRDADGDAGGSGAAPGDRCRVGPDPGGGGVAGIGSRDRRDDGGPSGADSGGNASRCDAPMRTDGFSGVDALF